MINGTTAAQLGRPVVVEGRLRVGEIRTEGVLVGLFHMEAGRVTSLDSNTFQR